MSERHACTEGVLQMLRYLLIPDHVYVSALIGIEKKCRCVEECGTCSKSFEWLCIFKGVCIDKKFCRTVENADVWKRTKVVTPLQSE